MSAPTRGPAGATLAEFDEVLDDDELFSSLDGGWRMLVVPQKDLAKHLGVGQPALSKRISVLRRQGFVEGRGAGLRFDAEAIAAGQPPPRPDAQVLSLRAHALRTGRAPSTEHYHRQRTGELRALDGSTAAPEPGTELDAAVAAWIEVATLAATHGDRALLSTAEVAVCGLARVAVCLAQQTESPRAANGNFLAVCSRDEGLKTNDDDVKTMHALHEGSRAPNGNSRAANGNFPAQQTATVDNHGESHSLADLAALARPLSDLIAERGGAGIDWNHHLVTAARTRTRDELDAVVAGLVANEFAIDNLAGAFYRSVVDGWDRWLTPPGPSPWDDPAPAPQAPAETAEPIITKPCDNDDWAGWVAWYRAHFAGHERDRDLNALAIGAIAVLPAQAQLEHLAVLIDEANRALREYGRQRDFAAELQTELVASHQWEINPEAVVRSCYPCVA
jgi:DNA-binding Lrp family transcriptional regulator